MALTIYPSEDFTRDSLSGAAAPGGGGGGDAYLGGDLSGNPALVVGINGHPTLAYPTAPGQVLSWDGTEWVAGTAISYPDFTGNAGKVLAVAPGEVSVEWITVSGVGTVTSVDASGGMTGLSFSGNPITGAGMLTLGGTLLVSHGGTGATTSTAALTNLLPPQSGLGGFFLKTDGSITSWATPFPSMTGNSLKVLRVNAGETAVEWAAVATGGGSGTVTSVDVSGGGSGLVFSGGPITSSGTINMGGTLYANWGGTGYSTLPAGQVLFGKGTGQSQVGVEAGLFWDASNKRLGINTASNPNYELDVIGGGSDSVMMRLYAKSAYGYARLIVENPSTGYGIGLTNSGASEFSIMNGGTVGFSMFPSGAVGIGEGNPGGSLLHVAGTLNLTTVGDTAVLKIHGSQVLKSPVAGVPATPGSATAGGSYTSSEQTMLQTVYDGYKALVAACRTHGFIS